jgi:poly(hydroxyalkanoate) depolymerase family esterase
MPHLDRIRPALDAAKAAASATMLKELGPTKQNPGNLRGLYYLPANLSPGAPLVVVLHGCTQTAADYDRGSGWSRLADRFGFALLFPEQKQANNGSNCFNWFAVGDSQRGMGEPASISAMIDLMRAEHQIDPTRVFITGLSAGGAMASVMLATYPETFAAGAIIAGLPFGCASDVRQAFDCMGGRAQAQAAELGAKVRRASPHKGPWPRISVWQGDADRTVAPSNADAIVLQWAHLHGLSPAPTRSDTVDGYPHLVWIDAEGRVAIERYDIIGMAHGTPLMPGEDVGQLGVAGAHMLDAQINSTDRIAAFFGIKPAQSATKTPRQSRPRRPVQAHFRPPVVTQPDAAPRKAAPLLDPLPKVRKVIEDALRTAGLLK